MNNFSALTGSLPLSSELSDLEQTLNGKSKESIKSVSNEFESIFYSILLKEMRQSVSGDEDGGLFPGENSDTLGGMFDLFLGQHLASSSQLGISQIIERYMSNKS